MADSRVGYARLGVLCIDFFFDILFFQCIFAFELLLVWLKDSTLQLYLKANPWFILLL